MGGAPDPCMNDFQNSAEDFMEETASRADRRKRTPNRHRWADAYQKKTEGLMKISCPACNSDHVKRSRSQNAVERLMKRFNRKAYRCLDCGWRGIVPLPKPGPFKARNGRTLRKIPWLPIVVVSLLLAAFLAFYLTREPSPSDSSSNQSWSYPSPAFSNPA